MMKISDPIMFGHCVSVYYQAALDKHAKVLSEIGFNPNKGLADLYDKLERVIMPLYYGNREGWVRVMKNAVGKNAYYFNSHRMMRRYVTNAYIRTHNHRNGPGAPAG